MIRAAALAAAVLGALLLPVTAEGVGTDGKVQPGAMPGRQNRLPLASEWPDGALEPRQHLRLAYGLTAPQADLLDRIVLCESGWKTAIKNGSSTASGLAQFLDSTWTNTRARMGRPDPGRLLKHDPYEHLDTFVWLWRADGTRHWLESKPCWNR